VGIQGTASTPKAGIQKVEWQVGNNAYQPALDLSGNWGKWLAIATLPPNLGSYPVTIRATDKVGNFTTKTVTVQVIDITGPEVRITSPTEGAAILWNEGGVSLTVSGTARDSQSGIDLVEWALNDPTTYHSAVPRAPGDWSTWSAPLQLPSLGQHIIYVKARDKKGNSTQQLLQRTIETTKIQGFGPEAYLRDLLKFATDRLKNNVLYAIQTAGGYYLTAVDGGGRTDNAIYTNARDVGRLEKLKLIDLGNGQIAIQTILGYALTAEGGGGRNANQIAISCKQKQIGNFEKFRLINAENSQPITLDNLGTGYVGIQTANEKYVTAVGQGGRQQQAIATEATQIREWEKFKIVPLTVQSEEITSFQLADLFHQPFDALTESAVRAIANQPVLQVRICIEVLRNYLTHQNISFDMESDYLQTAYYTLLRNLGTSYEELRLIRAAEDDSRKALATRLGIQLSSIRPDQLDQITLEAQQITEVILEELFGLADTTQNPLEPKDLPQSAMLNWQLSNLRALWQQQDNAAYSKPDSQIPIIDPDLLSENNLRTSVSGNAAYDSWQARQVWVVSKLEEVKAQRESASDALQGFDQIVHQFIAPNFEVETLAEAYKNGDNINPILDEQYLSLQAFLHLSRIRQLAITGIVLETEWADVYSILVQVQKHRQYAIWRLEEENANLILGPDDFQLLEVTSTALKTPPQWRATRQAQQKWLEALQARFQQEETVVQAFKAAVESTENMVLPILRDSLIAAFDPDQNLAELADQLSEILLIDLNYSGNQRTTRINQAIETLQSILFSVRAGRFNDKHPAAEWEFIDKLTDNTDYSEAKFDREWQWMGAYNTWRAAMLVFIYPEDYLYPSLREKYQPDQNAQFPTNVFWTLIKNIRTNLRLTPEAARLEAKEYLKKLGEVPSDDEPDPSLASLQKQMNNPSSHQSFARLRNLLNRSDFVLTDQLTEDALELRRKDLEHLFEGILNPHTEGAANYLEEIFYLVPMALALQLQKSGQYLATLDWIQTIYAFNLALDERKIYPGLKLEEDLPNQALERPTKWLLNGLSSHGIASSRPNTYSYFTVASLVRCILDFADSEFAQETRESIPKSRSLYSTALSLLNDLSEWKFSNQEDNPFPKNLMLSTLKLQAETNLSKLRSGRNLSGIELASTDSTNQLLESQSNLIRPTPYRYTVLIERSKQLVTIAQQVESAMLSAFEKKDVEAYSQFRANQDIDLTIATVQLQSLRENEINTSETLAQLQQSRSQIQSETYQEWIESGLNQWEQQMITSYKEARDAKIEASRTQAVSGILNDWSRITNPASALVWFTNSILSVGGLEASSLATQAETSAQIASIYSSFEQRRQEWQFQKKLAESDIQIGAQQILLVQSQRQVILQEKMIASIQAENAELVVDFLANKFTSAELYEWMSTILSNVYSYFLQQATVIARLAQNQLSFERQEAPPAYIQTNYWQSIFDANTILNTSNQEPDRKGLTGSVRLLQDIYKLDQYAFETNKHKLQLTQAFSLAQLAPFEFQQFRETGILPFATPSDLFDRDFPGHYLRLIKRVHLSVVALIPPVRGIRATLTASGISRVIVGQNVFTEVVVRRNPEMIAFTSPSNATGLFELQPEGELLLPFESMGVDTTWEFQLPKAANPFDYRTIADVLIIIEYTALHSTLYRQQVIQQFDRSISGDRPFSFRNQFADAWFDLNNPQQTDRPLVARFKLRREDFPPNVEDLTIQHLLCYVVPAEQAPPVETIPVTLSFTPQESAGSDSLTAVATTTEGVISTRRANGASWSATFSSQYPVGEWELELPTNLISQFEAEQIEDILFVITYQGRTPAWPA
jgi:hypothetical protein